MELLTGRDENNISNKLISRVRAKASENLIYNKKTHAEVTRGYIDDTINTSSDAEPIEYSLTELRNNDDFE